MLDFDIAQAEVLRGVTTLGEERVPLAAALDRVLAEEVSASEPVPSFDYSAMDGYAVNSAEFSGERSWTLPVSGVSRTGWPTPTFQAHTACRIFTGAALPSGTDAVLMQENVSREGDSISFSEPPRAWQNVRRRGEDLESGAVALSRGYRVGPAQLGLLATLGRASVTVAVRPRVTILCNGDELRESGNPGGPGTIPESNGVALFGLAQRAGAEVVLAPITADDPDLVAARIQRALSTSDVLVTVGGASVGDHDVIARALELAQVKLEFHKVRMKPGKPLIWGRTERAFVLGLPGNPVSAMVTFMLFGVPLLRALQGDARPVAPFRNARLASALKQTPGRRGFYRGDYAGTLVTPLGAQSSGAITSMAFANCLISVPAESPGYEAGETVQVLPFADV